MQVSAPSRNVAENNVSRTLTERRPQRGRRPILVVDDDAGVRDLVSDVLADAGYATVLAPDGERALRLMQDTRPALVLLDIQMPNVDGPSLARELRMRPREIPVIVVTGVARPGPRSGRGHAVTCLPKPFDNDALVRIVRRFAR